MIDKELLKLIGDKKKYVVYVVLFSVIGLLASISITAGICYCISLVIKASQGTLESGLSFLLPSGIILLSLFIRYAMTRLTGTMKEKLSREVKKDLRQKTYDKILRLGVRSTDGLNMAGLTQVAIEGIEQLDLYYSDYLPQFFYSMMAPFILFAICVFIDWRFSLLLIACVPVIPLSIVAVSRYAKKIFAKYWGIYTGMGDTFLDSVQGLKELKIFKADERKNAQIDKDAETFRKITMKVLVMQLCSVTIMDFVAFAGAGGGTALSILGIINGYLSIPNALFLILVAVEFFLPLRALGSAFHVAMNGASAGKKINSLLNAEEAVWGNRQVVSTDICLKNVSFSYDGKRDVTKNVDMYFPKCGMTAIVGESGCGKSTIVNLLIGRIHPRDGSIEIGGTDIQEISRDNYYSHIAAVSYDTYIFNDTIRNNFKLAKKNASDSEIMEALKEVNLEDFVRENGGIDKVILEDADNISGGQRQRLALAINLLSDKDIYIFDEATSNIDIESEAIIMENIIKMSKTKSIILISHRLANVVHADNIYYMEDGQVKEHGSHEELMKIDKGYASLYRTQKSLEEGYRQFISWKKKTEASL